MSKKSSVPAGASRRHLTLAVSEWPLRRKLALVLAIPMILAAVFGGLRVSDAVRDLREYEATEAQLTVLHPFVDYIDAVEEAAVVLRNTPAGSPKREAAMAAVREAAETLEVRREATDMDRELVRTLDRTIGASVALQEESGYAETTALLGQLRMLYAGVQEYVDLVVSDQLVPEPHLPELAFAIGGRLAFTVQQIQVGQLGSKVEDAYDVYGDLGMEEAALEQLFRIRGAEDIVVGLLQANGMRREQVMAGSRDLPYEDTFALYDELIGGVLEDTESTLAQWSRDAEREALLSAGVTVGALLLATLLALFVSRLLVRPVQRVRDGALSVAHEQLPAAVARIRAGEDPGEIEPIDVTTNEEMGQLARAVEDMHRAAVRLAAGEARLKTQVGEMFVTLSRRNTSLVNQQLQLIEVLERDEDDPERLQSLFRLDHLASRMRRTAESLVILTDAPVRQREQAALPVSEVIQAAAGGVQHYERVHVMGFPTEEIAGSAASDLVHLLTELIDNALSFSPPSTPVEVTTTTSSTETVIRVSDSGLGMPHQQREDLNEMLRSGGEVTPDTARRMGLFVVSRLAHRHGISVLLATNSRGGIIASVSIPPELLAAPPASLVSDRLRERALPDAPTAQSSGTSGAATLVEQAAAGPDPIVTAINAVTGLPQRRPGSTRHERVATVEGTGGGGLFDRTDAAPAAQPLLAQESRPAAPSEDPNGVTYRVPLVPRRSVTPPTADPQEPFPTPLQDQLQDRLRDQDAAPVLVAAGGATQPVADAGELPRRQPGATVPPLVTSLPPTTPPVSHPLQDPYDTIDHGHAPSEPGESPIFASLQSSWLGNGDHWGPDQADEGWRAAEAATEQPVEERSSSGLPQRRPGNRLVPGTAASSAAPSTPGAAVPVRDPEAVRARLSAHVAGVNRGRSLSTHSAPNHEEAGPA